MNCMSLAEEEEDGNNLEVSQNAVFNSPSELSGDLINALQGLGADRGLDLAEQPGGESAATVQPPPRHLPPAVPFGTTSPTAAAAAAAANRLRANGWRTKTTNKKSATRPKLRVRRTLTSVTCSCSG